MAETPIRTLRVPDKVWAEWHARAEAAGCSVTELILAAMVDGADPADFVELAPTEAELNYQPVRLTTTLEPVEPMAVLDPAEFIKPTGAGIVPDETAGLGETIKPCRHPKKFRDVKPYATFCSTELGGCGARL